jgi:hypothetical protein
MRDEDEELFVLIGEHDEGTWLDPMIIFWTMKSQKKWSMSIPQTMFHTFLDSWFFAQLWA